jgi:protein CpxP
MNKIKLLTFSVIGLLFLNIGIIGFLYFSRTADINDKFNQKPREIISEKLHFDANQIKSYDQLIEIHKDKIDSLNSKSKKIKFELYSQLKLKTINTIEKNRLINEMVNNQKEIENTYFQHFLDIKSLCKKDQIGAFNSLTNELGKMFSKQSKQISEGNQPPRPPRPESFDCPPLENHPPRPPRDFDRPGPPRDSLNHRPPPPRPPRGDNHPGPPRDDY